MDSETKGEAMKVEIGDMKLEVPENIGRSFEEAQGYCMVRLEKFLKAAVEIEQARSNRQPDHKYIPVVNPTWDFGKPTCVCGQPQAQGVEHRTDGPCYCKTEGEKP
jgi:hypothetical protein